MIDIKKYYQQYTRSKVPRKPVLRNAAFAFLIGGVICTVGQGINALFLQLGLGAKESNSLMLAVMILLGSLKGS